MSYFRKVRAECLCDVKDGQGQVHHLSRNQIKLIDFGTEDHYKRLLSTGTFSLFEDRTSKPTEEYHKPDRFRLSLSKRENKVIAVKAKSYKESKLNLTDIEVKPVKEKPTKIELTEVTIDKKEEKASKEKSGAKNDKK